MKTLILSLVLVGVVGCEPMPPKTQSDQCMRAELFKQCMKELPAGPLATHYNDWDEVVAQCDQTAYYQSMRATTAIKPECRAYD